MTRKMHEKRHKKSHEEMHKERHKKLHEEKHKKLHDKVFQVEWNIRTARTSAQNLQNVQRNCMKKGTRKCTRKGTRKCTRKWTRKGTRKCTKKTSEKNVISWCNFWTSSLIQKALPTVSGKGLDPSCYIVYFCWCILPGLGQNETLSVWVGGELGFLKSERRQSAASWLIKNKTKQLLQKETCTAKSWQA